MVLIVCCVEISGGGGYKAEERVRSSDGFHQHSF